MSSGALVQLAEHLGTSRSNWRVAAPNTKNRWHRITAVIEMPEKNGEGVIVAAGGGSAGYSLYVQNGKLVYHYNWFERQRTNLVSDIPLLSAGKSTVTVEFAYDGGGVGKGGVVTIGINGKEAGRARIENTVAGRFGMSAGMATRVRGSICCHSRIG